MIRTTCPKCGREDAVADYLAALPIMCNACGTRVTIGQPVVTRPALPPPVAPPPKPPPVVVSPPPPPPPKLSPPPPPPKTVPPPKPAPPPPPPVVPPPSPVTVTVPDELVMALDEVVPVPEPVRLVPAPRAAKRRPPPTPVAPEKPFPLPLAPVWRRVLARVLTLLGLAAMVGLGLAVLMFVPKPITRDVYITYAIVAAFPVIYLLVNAAMLARTGQDVGKRYAGIRIVNADGSKATEKTAVIKRDALTFILGLTGIGLIYWLVSAAMLFSKGGRTLHDRVAGTRVVRA